VINVAMAVGLTLGVLAGDTIAVQRDATLGQYVGHTVAMEAVVDSVERHGDAELLWLRRADGQPLVTVQSPEFGAESAMLERFSPGDGIIVTGSLSPAGVAYGVGAFNLFVVGREGARSIGLTANERTILFWTGVLMLGMIAVAVAMVRRSRDSEQLLGRGKARAEAQLSSVFMAMEDIVMVLGRDGTYLEVPTTAARGLLQPWGDLVGRNIRDVLPAEAADEVHQVILRALSSSEPVRYDYSLPVEGGFMSFSACVTRRGDDAVVWVARDVTEQRTLEAQLLQARKLEAIGLLAGGVAHDFNNILTVIGAHASFLLDGLPEGDPRRDDAVEISRSAARAAALTQQLLAFGRRQMLKPAAVDLNDVIRGMAAAVRRVMPDGVEVRVQPDSAQATVLVDFAQMEQVVMNLALNARDAMPGGGILTLATSDMTLDESSAGSLGLSHGPHVRLSVTDTGAGMDDTVLARIFEPFFTTKGLGRGTGLGLSSVHGIVRQSGGHISVSSRPGIGTVFDILLPCTSVARVETTQTPRAETRINETVLIAEDEPAVRQSASRILRRVGYEVLEAMDGRDALEVMSRHPGEIHLLLTDCIMPHMNGAELVRALRDTRPGTAVLFMSGFTEDQMIRTGMITGDERLIEKPFTGSALTSAVRAALDARKLARGVTEAA
jgi:PAS domain S-box-containing protein